MAIQKNFVVKNGLEVNSNLIFADTNSNKVGIATTIVNYNLHVNGGIGVTNLTVTGISTINNLVLNNLTLNGYVNVGGSTGKEGQVLVTTGTGVTWSTISKTSQVFSASVGQTIFSFSYEIGSVEVYINGVRLSPNEFVATDGSTVVLNDACFGDETVELLGNIFTPGIADRWTETFDGNVYRLSNVGVGTTNPNYALDVSGTTRITGFIESQNTSTNTNNVLTLDATKGTVFTHTTTGNIGIVSFTGISTNRANSQKFTVLVTQGVVGYNTTAATGIGTQLATVVTEGGVGYSTHIKVGGGTTITLTSTPGALDILTFIVSYNGVGIASTSFTVVGSAAQNFRGVI